MRTESALTSSERRPAEVVVFYSYKGGTGRSMLLSNVAWLLASVGLRVLVIDWDLEAPGLHRYFKPFLREDPELKETDGVIQWVTDYWYAAVDAPTQSTEILVRESANPRHYIKGLSIAHFAGTDGGIDFLGPGRQDASYADSVADFDWGQLYENLKGEEFIRYSKEVLAKDCGYDFVLVDSRTGVSDTSGICTVGLADTLVVCFTYNNQSVIGAANVAADIRRQAEQRRSSQTGPETGRTFRVLPVPSRVDDLDPERLERRQRFAWDRFSELLSTEIPRDQQQTYWVNVQIKHQGFFSYEEVLAACVNRPGDPQSVLGSVTQLVRVLTDGAVPEGSALSDVQRRTLRELFADDLSTEAVPRESAWARLNDRGEAGGELESLLEDCFPLLIQLYAPAEPDASSLRSDEFVRVTLAELELSGEERRMADRLISSGVIQRRVTDQWARGLAVADDSIASDWHHLRHRLHKYERVIRVREQIKQARRTWEASGRSVAALGSFRGNLSQWRVSDGQAAMLGRLNLQFLNAINDHQCNLQAVEQGETARMDAEFRVEKSRAKVERLRRRLQGALVGGVGLAALVVIGPAILWYYLAAQHQESAELLKQLEGARTAAAQSEARAIIAEGTLAKREADFLYSEGQRQMSLRDYQGALTSFTSAVQKDPLHAESYLGRATARAKSTKLRDINSELDDYAIYYDLRPSFSGRLQLALRATQESKPDVRFLASQITKLAEEAGTLGAQPDDIRSAARRLEVGISRSFDGMPTELRDALALLKKNADGGSAQLPRRTPKELGASVEANPDLQKTRPPQGLKPQLPFPVQSGGFSLPKSAGEGQGVVEGSLGATRSINVTPRQAAPPLVNE